MPYQLQPSLLLFFIEGKSVKRDCFVDVVAVIATRDTALHHFTVRMVASGHGSDVFGYDDIVTS